MTSIKWIPTYDDQGRFQFRRAQGPSSAAFTRRIQDQADEARTARQRPLLEKPLTAELTRRLTAFSKTLKDFSWPEPDTPFAEARLVVADPRLDGKLSADLPAEDERAQYYRLFSRGLSPDAPVTIVDPGDYEFTLTAGSDSESVALTVQEGWTNRELMDAVAGAVNATTLPVQAHAIRQDSPQLMVPGQVATGVSLGIAVNAAFGPLDVSLTDTEGHLAGRLDLRETSTAIGPAATGRHTVARARAAHPTTFTSTSFDPGAATTLAAGTYTFDYAYGEQSGQVELGVADGETWKDVLTNLKNAVDSSTTATRSRLLDQTRPSDLTDEYMLMDGVALEIAFAAPKEGERLRLTGADDASAQALAVLGMDATARPGTDAVAAIDGWDKTRAPGTFAVDDGSLRLDLEQGFGESLPVSVVRALDTLETGVTAAVDDYNALRELLVSASDQLREDAADLFRAPVAERALDLAWTGIREFGPERLLWAEFDTFHQALGQDADRARAVLADGLFADWLSEARAVLDAGADSLLRNEASLADPDLPEPTPRTEVDLDKGYTLLDLYADGADTPPAPAATFTDLSKATDPPDSFWDVASGRLVDDEG